MDPSVNQTVAKIAVIMSVYRNDSLRYLSQAVESILGQNYRDFDFYIQLDGPVPEMLSAYLNQLDDPRVQVRKRNENRGLAYSLNELLDIVLPLGYEFIARMDADDCCAPDRFERQLLFYQTHPEVECLGSWAIEIDKDGNEFFRKKMPQTHEECYSLFKIRDCVIHPSVMFRSSFFKKAGLYPLDTFFAEDTILWAQGFRAGCIFANVPEFLYLFRLDEHFFERRRGWEHAKNVLLLRFRVNRMLHYGLGAYVSAFLYAFAKMLPEKALDLVYRIIR